VLILEIMENPIYCGFSKI